MSDPGCSEKTKPEDGKAKPLTLVVILQGPVAASSAGRGSLGSVLGLQSKAHMKRAFGWDDLAWGAQQRGP